MQQQQQQLPDWLQDQLNNTTVQNQQEQAARSQLDEYFFSLLPQSLQNEYNEAVAVVNEARRNLHIKRQQLADARDKIPNRVSSRAESINIMGLSSDLSLLEHEVGMYADIEARATNALLQARATVNAQLVRIQQKRETEALQAVMRARGSFADKVARIRQEAREKEIAVSRELAAVESEYQSVKNWRANYQ